MGRLTLNPSTPLRMTYAAFQIISVMLLLMLAASCEKDFIPDELTASKKMTVNCLFDNYQAFHVYLTESATMSGSGTIISLSDANAQLFEDEVFKEALHYTPSDSVSNFGSFQSSFIPQPGKKYSVKVNHPVYGLTTTEDVMPNVTVITSASLITAGSVNQNKDAIVEISFEDDAGTENFYRINPWLSLTSKVYNPETGDSTEQVTTKGIRIETEEAVTDSVRDNGWALLFSDKNFNGQHKTMRLHFKAVRLSRYTHVNLFVDLNNVSSSHFEYFRTLDLYRHSNRSDDELVEVYCNIQNGYGIFAGSAVSSALVVMK